MTQKHTEDVLKELSIQLGDLNSRLSSLNSNRKAIDYKIEFAIGSLKNEKDSITKSIYEVSKSIGKLSEKIAKFELENAAEEIKNATLTIKEGKRNAIDAVRKYNSMFLALKRADKIDEDDLDGGVLAIVKTRSQAREEDGGSRAWIDAYDVDVVEHEHGWFPSEIGC